MDDGPSSSVRSLPPGRLTNIRQQFEQKSPESSSKPNLPTKTSRPPKVPQPRAGKVNSPNNVDRSVELTLEQNVVLATKPSTPPKSMDIPPIPPKENSKANKMQLFSPPSSNIPQPLRGKKSPVKHCISPKAISGKPLPEISGKIHHAQLAQLQKDKNSTSLHSVCQPGISSPRNNEEISTTPKKDKPPLMDKPKLTKKTVLSENIENSPNNAHSRQRSPIRQAQRGNVLQTSKSLSGDWLCLVEEKYTGVKGREPKEPPPKPPVKPPRTHAHDKYLDAKPVNPKVPISPKRGGTLTKDHNKAKRDNCDHSTMTLDRKEKRKISRNNFAEDTSSRQKTEDLHSRPEKPKRPPPPRPKSSPSFSSVKGFSYQDDLSTSSVERKSTPAKSPVFDRHGRLQQQELTRNIIYEPVSSNLLSNRVVKPSPIMLTSPPGVHHNALHNRAAVLPSRGMPPPAKNRGLWRSCSDECVYMDPSLSGDPVYMDPMESCRVTALDDTYASHDVEVYIDADGYAVPHRFNKQRGPQSPGPGVKDKFRGLFRMFSDPFQQGDSPKLEKRRVVAVKQKINQAFALLQKIVKKRESGGDQNKETSDRTSLDSDSFIDVSEIIKRVEYVNSVKLKTYASVRNVRLFMDTIYPQLFECAVIVELLRKNVDGTLTNVPVIKHKFPEMVNIAETIPQFCFPDSEHINIRILKANKSETYSFVLTNAEGNHVFGYCRRYTVSDEGVKRVEVICILSPVGAFQMYHQLLDEIEIRRKLSFDTAQELIASSFGRPLPNPGKNVNIRTMTEEGEVESIVLRRLCDNRLENVNYETLLSVLGVDKLVKVFASMLLERKLLFFASNLSVLSTTIQALVSLLYPFLWHHTFIPVLPPSLMEIVCAPTPFIIGALSSEMSSIDSLPMDEALVIDLDSKCLFKVMGDEATILPKKIQKALKTALNLCRLEADKQSQNLMMSEAFIRLFVELVGHFGEFIITQPDGKKVFQKEAFISGVRSDSITQLLQWFTETQMFEVFITDQLEKEHHRTAELFITRIMEYKDSGQVLPSIKSNVKEIGRKMKNFGKAIKTKLT